MNVAATPPEASDIPAIEVGLDIVTDRPVTELERLWRSCDAGGLTTIGVPDSPAICRDLYLTGARCLETVSRSRVLTAVSNPVSRDVAVTAAALCTLAERHPGRIDFGIGTGDSALWGVGLKSSKVARLREYIVALRALLRGDECTFDGRVFRLRWDAVPEAAADIGIYVACSGPRVLTMAAEVADGAILHMGFSPEDVAYVDELIGSGAARGERDAATFRRWWHCSLKFAASVEEGMNENLGINPGWLTLATMDGKRVPDEYREPLRQLTADFRNLDAEYAGKGRPAALVDRAKALGIYEWLAGRGSRLWGTPADIASRLEEYRARGMHRWIFYGGGRDLDLECWIEAMSEGVLSRLGASDPPATDARPAS